jgi:DNA-binding NtrC family response regulator
MEANEKQLNILVIDDDPVIRNLTRSILKQKSNVYAVEKPSLAFKILKNETIDILICDYHLPEMNGLKVLQKVKEEYPVIEVIMISNAGNMDTVIDALRKGAADFFKKPFTAAQIWVAIERTKRYAELNSHLSQYKRKVSLLKKEVNKELGQAIIGKSAEIKNIKEQMQMVAQTPDTSVLIIGESGTGKELVARGIHNMSSRKDEMFGAVNMSAIPEMLFESEFFGHRKGSFTGAIADKAGWFESTNNGTLFFDEIGEMTMALQVKLLRVLEDRKFVRMGTQREQDFDLRIISATNKTIEELTSGKNFRTDLYHRLGVFIIHIPPLRERKQDIRALADSFLSIHSKNMGKQITSINPEVYDLLSNYPFPGNIRELRNLIERAVIVCQSEQLLPQHFNISRTNIPNGNTDIRNSPIYDLKELEKQTIIRVLHKVKFNKAEAARILNLEWNALYRRIQKYNIEFPKENP